MIQYALKCNNDHTFNSWFQSAAAFDKLIAAKLITCEFCGSTHVDKAIMAPRVTSSKNAKGKLTSSNENHIEDVRKKVEETSEYVGKKFATEARSMHLGDTKERSIYGEAKLEDAKKLIDDGIPIIPLPFMPKRKKN